MPTIKMDAAPPRCAQWRPASQRHCWRLFETERKDASAAIIRRPNLPTKWNMARYWNYNHGFQRSSCTESKVQILSVRKQLQVVGALPTEQCQTRSVKHDKGSRTMRRAGEACSQPVASHIWSGMGILLEYANFAKHMHVQFASVSDAITPLPEWEQKCHATNIPFGDSAKLGSNATTFDSHWVQMLRSLQRAHRKLVGMHLVAKQLHQDLLAKRSGHRQFGSEGFCFLAFSFQGLQGPCIQEKAIVENLSWQMARIVMLWHQEGIFVRTRVRCHEFVHLESQVLWKFQYQ